MKVVKIAAQHATALDQLTRLVEWYGDMPLDIDADVVNEEIQRKIDAYESELKVEGMVSYVDDSGKLLWSELDSDTYFIVEANRPEDEDTSTKMEVLSAEVVILQRQLVNLGSQILELQDAIRNLSDER